MKIRKRNYVFIAALSYVLLIAVLATTLWVVGLNTRVIAYHSVRVSDEMYAWWQAYNRRKYIVDAARDGIQGAEDTPLFWRLPARDNSGRTNEEVCNAETRLYAERIVVSAYLFDYYGYTLTDEEIKNAKSNLDSLVDYQFDGDEKAFDRVAKQFGFSLSAAKQATVLELKREALRSSMSADALQRDAYYKDNYIKVKWVWIKTSDADYDAKASMLNAALADVNADEIAAGTDAFSDAVSDERFNQDGSVSAYPNGYYLSRPDDFTVSQMSTIPAVIDAAFGIAEEGQSASVTVTVTDSALASGSEERTYFIRRYPLDSLAYEKKENEHFFTNFTRFASETYFIQWRDTYVGTAETKWFEKNLPAWTPAGRDSELLKFFRIG